MFLTPDFTYAMIAKIWTAAMPTGSHHQSFRFVKLLLLGDSGSGKTGAMISLVRAGFRLGILDYDNGLDILISEVKRECPERLDSITYETLSDLTTSSPAGEIPLGVPEAFSKGLALMDNWKGNGTAEGYSWGPINSWGPDSFFVIDSLTFMAKAAFRMRQALSPGLKDPRQWYFQAQGAVAGLLERLKSEACQTNVLVCTHIDYDRNEIGIQKGFPRSIGSALGPSIGAYFNSMLLVETSGIGKTAVRTIKTVPNGLVDLKNTAPHTVPETLPHSTGLATFVSLVRELPLPKDRPKT